MNLADLTARLSVPGLPEWSGLVVLLLILLMVVAFLAMPFSVFGVKSRLDALESQLDEIQAEIRSLALRLPEPVAPRRVAVSDDGWEPPPSLGRTGPTIRDDRPPRVTPPIPPAASWPEAARDARRTEPRLGNPRR